MSQEQKFDMALAIPRELFWFTIVGGASTLCYIIVFLSINRMTTLDPAYNSAISYLAGMLISYWGQSRLTFKNKNDGAREVTRYIMISILGIVASIAIMGMGVGNEHIPVYVGLILVCITVPVFSFILMKLWAFKKV